MNRQVLLIGLLGMGGIPLFAQDIDPFFAPRAGMVLDPARTGSDPGVQIHLLHLDQWLQLPGTWRSEVFAVEWCARNTKKKTGSWLGLGATTTVDRNGVTGGRVSSMSFTPAMHLRSTRRSHLSFGMELRLVNGRSGNEGAWASQYDGLLYDASIASGEASSTGSCRWMEARAGISWALKHDVESPRRRERNAVVVGLAADHLGQLVLQEEGLAAPRVPLRITGYALVEQPLGIWDNGYFGGDVIAHVQGPFWTARINAQVGKHLLNVVPNAGSPRPVGFRTGMGYRYRDALLVHAGLDLTKLSVNLAYGWAVASAGPQVRGRRTVELGLQFRIGVDRSANR